MTNVNLVINESVRCFIVRNVVHVLFAMAFSIDAVRVSAIVLIAGAGRPDARCGC
jgi:hypothetical protein